MLNPGKMLVGGAFELLNAVLEFRKAGADAVEFPIMVQLNADFLIGQPALQKGYARSDLLHLGAHEVGISCRGLAWCAAVLEAKKERLGVNSVRR